MIQTLIHYRTTIITITILIAIIIAGAFFISTLDEKQAERELAESDAAAILTDSASSTPYTDFAGNQAKLDQHLGQVLVVNSWASWSPFSGTELSLLADVVSAYDTASVQVIAINRAESKRIAESYLRTIGVDQRVKLIVDQDDRYYREIEGYTMPETLFYDRRGNVVHHHRGPLTASQVRYYIDQSLAVE